MKYIMIMEGESVFKSDTLSEDDKLSCDAGILEVIDVATGKTYYEGEWVDLDVWGYTPTE